MPRHFASPTTNLDHSPPVLPRIGTKPFLSLPIITGLFKIHYAGAEDSLALG